MTLSHNIDVTQNALFFALTNAPALQEWLADDVRLEPRPGGRFYFWWRPREEIHGTVSQMVAGESLTLCWEDAEGKKITAIFELEEEDGSTRIALTLTGAGEDTVEWWRMALENLASVLETGIDLRQTRRPFLGIGGGAAITPEIAAALDVPVSVGFRVQSVVDGSGAAEAGVVADDVVVRVGEQPIVDGASLRAAMAGVAVGDTLPITFYRGTIQMTVEVTVTPPPQPPLPAGPAEMAKQVRSLHAEFERALAEMVEGAPAAAFEYRPEPNAWTARELLAHLIVVERWSHHYLALRVAGQPQGGYANDSGVHVAVSRAYDGVGSLLEEFRRAQATTATALEYLPQSLFAKRRGVVASITSTFTMSLPFHTHTHIEEIRHRLEAARNNADFAKTAERK